MVLPLLYLLLHLLLLFFLPLLLILLPVSEAALWFWDSYVDSWYIFGDDVYYDDCSWAKRSDPVLDLASWLIFQNFFIRASSTLLVHLTPSTNYCSNIFLANIPKQEISKLGTSLLNNTTSLCGQVIRGSCSIRLLLENITNNIHKR